MKNSNVDRSASFLSKNENDKEKEKSYFRRVAPIEKSKTAVFFSPIFLFIFNFSFFFNFFFLFYFIITLAKNVKKYFIFFDTSFPK